MKCKRFTRQPIRVALFLLVTASLMVASASTAHGQTCCWRAFRTEISVPAGISHKTVRSLWDSVFTKSQHGGGPLISDCEPPVSVEPGAPRTSLEYMFQGSLTRSGGSFSEDWNLQVDLVDVHHGEVVKSGDAAWQCKSSQSGYCDGVLHEQVRTLAQSFHPLDGVIHRYERMPNSATAEPDEEPIYSKDQVRIDVQDIKDLYGSAPQPWQRILAKVEEGKILNGEPRGDYRVFDVDGGSVQIEYEAPDVCEEQTETLTIKNTCHMDPTLMPPDGDDDIVTKDFDILPKADGQLDFSYTTIHLATAGRLNIRHSGKVRYTVDYDQDPPKISGAGSIGIDIDGRLEPCKIQTTGARIGVKLEGIVLEVPDGESLLQFEIEKSYNYSHAGVLDCPDGSGPIIGRGGGFVKSQLEFPIEDGYVLAWETRGGSGMHEVTLKLDCP
jgi:hypothetical protein